MARHNGERDGRRFQFFSPSIVISHCLLLVLIESRHLMNFLLLFRELLHVSDNGTESYDAIKRIRTLTRLDTRGRRIRHFSNKILCSDQNRSLVIVDSDTICSVTLVVHAYNTFINRYLDLKTKNIIDQNF